MSTNSTNSVKSNPNAIASHVVFVQHIAWTAFFHLRIAEMPMPGHREGIALPLYGAC
jgi:hypothetical protein